MPLRLENTIKVSIPDINHEVRKLPTNHKCRDQFLQSFRYELSYCIVMALQANEGQVVFSDLRTPPPDQRDDGQYIMQFEVFDRTKPRRDQWNFHGQNVSQWVYAGAILYQDGRVSMHH